MLCKKCEPEQKTASKLVDAEQRESLACVKKIKSAIIHQRWLSCLGAAKLWLLRKLIRRRFFCPAPFFKIITDKVYVSAYQSNRLFMRNTIMASKMVCSESQNDQSEKKLVTQVGWLVEHCGWLTQPSVRRRFRRGSSPPHNFRFRLELKPCLTVYFFRFCLLSNNDTEH